VCDSLTTLTPIDPFGGTPDERSVSDSRTVLESPWPPTDPAELAALDADMDRREREWIEANGPVPF